MRLFALLVLALVVAGCAAPESRLDPENPSNFQTSTPPAAGAPVKVTLAIQPTANVATLQDNATDMERFLEERMKAAGVDADVEIYIPLSHAGVVEALRFGHADAAMMSAWPATIASERAGARVVLAEMREVSIGNQSVVAPYYYSYYVVRPDSPYQTLADLEGKTVAYPSATSTSGYIFPVAKLVEDSLIPSPAPGKEADPKQHFGNVVFAGGYQQAWEALKNGQVDVAVTAGDINAKLYSDVLANTRIVATQGPVPSHAVVFAKEFEGPEADALKAALLELKGEKRAIMRSLVSGIFVEFEETTTAEHIAGLSDALAQTGLKFQEKL